MAKITGIGGVFLKCKGDSAALSAWYQKHLGMPLESWGGAVLRWPDDKAEDNGLTVCLLSCVPTEWPSTVVRNHMRTASSHGSWIRMETRLSFGNRCAGTTRTKVPEVFRFLGHGLSHRIWQSQTAHNACEPKPLSWLRNATCRM